MKFFEFFSAFISQSLSFLSPNELINQLVVRLQRALKTIIILVVCTAMSCVTLAYLIDRFLNQLDAGEFVLSRSIILLLVILVCFVGCLLWTLKDLAIREEIEKKKVEQARSDSALEAAVAALIMSFVNDREEKRKPTPKDGPESNPISL